MKRLFLSIKSFFAPTPTAIETISGKSFFVNDKEPVLGEGSKIVLSSRDDDDLVEVLNIKNAREPSERVTYREMLINFIKNEPRAERGFTAVELYNWMDRSLPMSAISKTLYRMRICGDVVSSVKEDDGRIRIWKLVNQN
jgi:hypothetical protein